MGRKYTTNEDFFILARPETRYGVTEKHIDRQGRLYVLCDGMGGAKSGEVASELSCGWVVRDFYAEEESDVLPHLTRIIMDVNRKIFDLAAEHEQYRGMCTTLVALHIKGDRLAICSVGDSRAYRFRSGELTQLTRDQSEIWSLYAEGSITKEELRVHPRSHILLRAIGSERLLEPADIVTVKDTVLPDDLFLLCSDGLSDMVPEPDIAAVLTGKGSLSDKTQTLVDLANDNGGKDNITVILVEG